MTDREIKGRIKNVEDTVKITRAMQMIATTKIYGYQKRRDNAEKYLEDVKKASKIAMSNLDAGSPLFKEKGGRSAYIVITGDKGLCGDYNTQVLNLADKMMEGCQERPKIFVIGFVGREYYKGKQCSLVGTYIHLQLSPVVIDSVKMADDLLELFLKANFNDLHVVYSKVEGMGRTYPVCEKILPITYESAPQKGLILGESNPELFLKELIIAQLYYAISSSALAVNYRRMIAMRQATVNGEEMIDDLKIQFNRTRQDKITNELNDAASASNVKK